MQLLSALNARLSRWTMYLACLCLACLLMIVVYGVIMRYVFNNAPPYVEQVALLLIISVSMFGASAGVRDAGHIGLDSLVKVLPARIQFWCKVLVYLLSMTFAVALFAGSAEMATSTWDNTIPTIGLSEAVRYVPVLIAGVLITLFAIEHLVAQFTGTEVIKSWH
ncbi:TRAP transporter small permease [Rhodoferax sp.]|uniref:TRAP transporter small permease n=1 Tax=Rhodoferax sp. TaxID=50421 RepID=UPI00284B53B9|nr:TRAP transporter small permease [Rhodoferax sp.]MDR3370053.1 TRAP transporter small permease [Rhodoferax sp.]